MIDRCIQAFISGSARRRWRQCGAVLLAGLFLAAPAWPQSGLTPYDVESAYLYNFGKFARWPANTGPGTVPFSICILGENPFGERLNRLVANESVQGRPILTRRLTSVADAGACQIVFLADSEEPRVAQDLAALQKKPILTVSNVPGFLEHGGMIQFLEIDNRVRFSVNLASVQQSGLVLSSELLKVAVQVSPGTSQEGVQ